MKHLNGDKVRDNNGQEWTVWATQITSSSLGKTREMCLCYASSGEVKVTLASLMVEVKEEE